METLFPGEHRLPRELARKVNVLKHRAAWLKREMASVRKRLRRAEDRDRKRAVARLRRVKGKRQLWAYPDACGMFDCIFNDAGKARLAELEEQFAGMRQLRDKLRGAERSRDAAKATRDRYKVERDEARKLARQMLRKIGGAAAVAEFDAALKA